MKRRDLVRFLEEIGFRSIGGTNHKGFRNGNIVVVPRRREIREPMAIIKKPGLR